jgi:Holliday junction resolvase RusA-like endonuclease
MSGILGADEIVRGLVAAGVPREKAEREAARECGYSVEPSPRCGLGPLPPLMPDDGDDSDVSTITLRIPWSCLVSDNAKFRVGVKRTRTGNYVGAFILTAEYRRARDTIKRHAKEAMGDRLPMDSPLRLTARVWVPDNHARDVVNFSKACHDALQKVVFTDDRWLHDVRWIRAGVDVDAPRAELVIEPLLAPAPSGFKVAPFRVAP